MQSQKVEETESIRAFVIPAKRKRMIELLANPKRRRKATSSLHHFHDLDPRWVVPLASEDQNASGVERVLRIRGAPKTCDVISADARIDGQRMPLSEALERVIGYGMGTLISCVPGSLAFFEGEGPSNRCILARHAIPQS